ncbi:MAG: hypothetical protein RJQ00_00760 [Vicingaceae bacterium]
MKSLISILFLLISSYSALAQSNMQLSVKGIEGDKIEYKKIIKSKADGLKEGAKILQQLYASSYLSASIDSTFINKDELILIVNKGEPFEWIKLSRGNMDPKAEATIDLSSRLFLNRPFNPKQLAALYERTVRYYEDNGYPFVSVKLDSIEINDENQISAALHIEKNQFYKIDSILIRGKSGIQEAFLFNQLELKEGMPYHESNINNIATRIQEVPFVSEEKPTEVQFFEEGVKIILNLKKKNASRFDGVLGLLTSEDDGSIELTGDVDLNLINSFNRGENIGLNWRKLKGNSQDLNLKFIYPFFFNTPFGVDFNFKLFKRDTTFLELTTRLGVNYNLRRGELVTLFIENKSSSLLSRNSLLDPSVSNPLSLGDVSTNSFGINYQLSRLDYRFNPTKGLAFIGDVSVGLKKLSKISSLEEEFPTIYDDVELNTTQYTGLLKIKYFIPLASRSTILIGNQSAGLFSENIYANELLRIGGLKLLRGFDEESINASSYSIFTLEYRFLLDRNSYLSLFTDGGFYENNADDYINDTPFGIGAGISFETNAGIFTFNYAVGKQFDNPIEFQAAKIHFGFVNFF